MAPLGGATALAGRLPAYAPSPKLDALSITFCPVAQKLARQDAPLKPQLQHSAKSMQVTPVPQAAWQVGLCAHCHLPIGSVSSAEGEGPGMHAECQAQIVVQVLRQQEEAKAKKDAAQKRARRAKLDIGWKAQRVPRNVGPARALECDPSPLGFYCTALPDGKGSLRALPTKDPAAAVNLEYLSLALQVRKRDGREPFFSLDARDDEGPGGKESRWQVKRVEPTWLAGTSVAEVMFQADYHLKELSMGMYEQPVVGMRSCFDFSEDEGHDQEWNAREWFVVRRAEVRQLAGGVLVPHVQMGVEAREQIKGSDGLEDCQITRPDHPLVKYAEDFTHYFDLIAERKSVVYHLRELAKASVLAKFLVEGNVPLDDSWLNLASAAKVGSSCTEIPQLWNERTYSQLRVADGEIVGADKGIGQRVHGVYGGVQFGLEKFRLPVQRMAPGASAAALAIPRALSGADTRDIRFDVAPRGVDLNLDGFDLSTVSRTKAQEPAGSWDGVDFIGSAFWPSIKSNSKAASTAEDKAMLRELFNPNLSDRRDEGDYFTPPGTSPELVSSLRSLLKEEEAVRHERKELFLSADFSLANAGQLFPASWVPSSGIARGLLSEAGPVPGLHARPDLEEEAVVLMQSATPEFDRSTEDGTRFRIYRAGSVEVRSIQEHDSKEEKVGGVFSIRESVGTTATARSAAASDAVVKAVEYVELVQSCGGDAGYREGPPPHRYYVVLETVRGDAIVTERLASETVTWAENPTDLEARNSRARVVRSVVCGGGGVTVRDMRRHQMDAIPSTGSGGTASAQDCALYAHGVCRRAAAPT